MKLTQSDMRHMRRKTPVGHYWTCPFCGYRVQVRRQNALAACAKLLGGANAHLAERHPDK